MKPFGKYDLSSIIKERNQIIEHYINGLSDDDIMSEQDEIILNNMYEQYKFELVNIEDEVLENRTINKSTVRKANHFRGTNYYEPDYYEIEGIKVISTFPYSGDKLLFESRANTYSLSGHPEIELYNNYFTISASETLDFMSKEENKNVLFNKISRDLEHVKKFVEYCNCDCNNFNNSIKSFTQNLIDNRRQKIEKYYNISKMLEIPIERSNPKMIEEIKIERKIIPLVKSERNSEPQYSISDEIYLSILDMIKHQGSTFERTPYVYNSHCEEDLRDIILGYLNGLFKGKANGECFRKKGKTDITIEYENRAAFVAECKFWGGQKVLTSALSQLLSYTTWRDNKLCLIMFSKNKDFFKVLEEIKNTFDNSEDKILFKEIDKNEFEYKLKSTNNENQIVTVRIYAFDLSD